MATKLESARANRNTFPDLDPDSAHSPDRTGVMTYVMRMLRSLAPSLGLSVVGTVALYLALRPMFPTTSTVPLVGALAFPLTANVISLVRRRRVDVFGVVVIVGLGGTAIAAVLGGSQRIVLMRETFVTGASGLVLLASLLLTRPVGYYFARHLLTGNDPARYPHFTRLWALPRFRRFVRGVTALWGCLSLGEFLLQGALVLTLPVVAVLALTAVVVELPRFAGLAISLVATRRVIVGIRSDAARSTGSDA